jgi:low temperature requirement protein LtrA
MVQPSPGPGGRRRGELLPRRRVHDWGEARRATWLELFFDLVFVVAVARLDVLLHDDHSARGVLVAAGLLVAIWWAWISFSYFADLFDEDGPLDRVAQLLAMLGAAVLAVTIGGGVEEDGRVFAATFAVMFLFLGGLYAHAGQRDPRARELCRWYVAGSLSGAALWALSIAIPAPAATPSGAPRWS